MSTQVYWIRAAHHSNMMLDGYIGVSKNSKNRWQYGHLWSHKNGRHDNPKFSNAIAKHGWDNLIKEILVIGEEKYCYELELKLRPNTEIGWNLAIGGGKPPVSKYRGDDYMSPLKGVPRPTPWMIGSTPANKSVPASNEAKAKMSIAGKGRIQTTEQVAKRVASRIATLASQGRTH